MACARSRACTTAPKFRSPCAFHCCRASLGPYSINKQSRSKSNPIVTAVTTAYAAHAFPRRTLRSGKEFSAFDLALARVITPPMDFDFGTVLQEQLAEEALTDMLDEDPPPDDDDDDDYDNPVDPGDDELLPEHAEPLHSNFPTPGLTPPPSLSLPPPPLSSLSATARNKLKSRACHDKKRQEARTASTNPLLKSVHRKRIDEAKKSTLHVDIDAGALPHAKTAWPAPLHEDATGLGGVVYTQEQVDVLTGTPGLMYCEWLGHLAIPIVDRKCRVVGVLGEGPRDCEGWKTVTNGAFALLQERVHRIHLPDDRLHHRPAQDSFPALFCRWLHGGGQMVKPPLVDTPNPSHARRQEPVSRVYPKSASRSFWGSHKRVPTSRGAYGRHSGAVVAINTCFTGHMAIYWINSELHGLAGISVDIA
ncbi:hypothetical protein DFH08DRAFT_823602 [Mycena albidolilacea]|uniref:Uncharacterized protein n=1 Tax=Mycena albidolilacea TaxID=1033008 RepID=A0AAD6Z5Q2_9AGAR|nr:hypothetical protein DFH08DRAFT_823602 [Mycena albidolilacea]